MSLSESVMTCLGIIIEVNDESNVVFVEDGATTVAMVLILMMLISSHVLFVSTTVSLLFGNNQNCKTSIA